MHAHTHATSVRWSWWHSPSVRPGVYGCRVAAWHLQKGRLCLALAARQGGFQEVLYEGSAGATHSATVHKPSAAQLARWKAPTGNGSLPGLSVASDSFNLANICSVHLHVQSHQRSSGSQRLYRSLQKKAEWLSDAYMSFANTFELNSAALFLIHTHKMRRPRPCKWIPQSQWQFHKPSHLVLMNCGVANCIARWPEISSLETNKKKTKPKKGKTQTFKETHSWDIAKTGMIHQLENRCIEFAFILLWNIN